MRWLSRLVTVAIFAAVAAAIVIAVAGVVRPPRVEGSFRTVAWFRDASGLPVGSRVVIAGVTVGQIENLTIEGNLARVDIRVVDDVVIWDDGWATKKANSALGDNYVEISPGGPDPTVADGTGQARRRLRHGNPIPRVVEAATTDTVMRSIDRSLPRLDDGIAAANAFLEEGRHWVSGSFGARIALLDERLAAGAITTPLQRVARQSAAFESGTIAVTNVVARATPKVVRQLRELPSRIAAVTADLRGARSDLHDALGSVDTHIGDVDPYLVNAADLLDALSGRSNNDRGRLARMVQDSADVDSITALIDDVESFTGTMDRLKTTLGFRAEQNILSRQPRFYVTAELSGRNDQFYLIEAEKGPTGDNPTVELSENSDSREFSRVSFIPERLRFTAQWGRRFEGFAVRLGIKESQFGAGVDWLVAGGRLKLTVDAMESSFSIAPRIKVTAAMAILHSVYILGGVDDALTPGEFLPVGSWGEQEQPIQFAELRYGRDYFLGFEIRIHDNDINRLLLAYGGVISTMLSR